MLGTQELATRNLRTYWGGGGRCWCSLWSSIYMRRGEIIFRNDWELGTIRTREEIEQQREKAREALSLSFIYFLVNR